MQSSTLPSTYPVPPSPASPLSTKQNPYGPPIYAPSLPSRPASPVFSDDKIRQEEWKYTGYPGFSKWMNSSTDFLILRRFGQLGTRVALLLQDDLVRIEEDLRVLDHHTMTRPDNEGICGSIADDRGSPREAVLRRAAPQLQQYWEYLDAFSRWKTQSGAQDAQVRNVDRWLRDHRGAIRKQERSFIKREGDLVALVNKPKSILRTLLELCRPLQLLFSLPHRDDRDRAANVRYYSDRHFETFTSLVIVIGGLLMLFGPMWWLNVVDNSFKRLGIITGFVSVFAFLLFGATTSATRGFEVLAATAAYAAVLTVFLQNSGPSSPASSTGNVTTLLNTSDLIPNGLVLAYRNFVS